MQGKQLFVEFVRAGFVTRQAGGLKIGTKAGRDVGSYRNAACTSASIVLQRHIIVAANLGEACTERQTVCSQPGHVTACVLDPDDPFRETASEFDHGFRLDVGHRSAGDIVEHDRQIDPFGQIAEVRQQPGLARPVIIGRDHQRGLGPDRPGFLHVPQRGLGIVAAAAGYYRHPAIGLLDRHREQAVLFVVAQRRCFAGGAAGDQSGRPLCDLPVNQAAKCRFIDRAILKRGDKSRNRAGKHGLYP